MPKRILIVDDQPEVRELVSVTLKVDDFQIYEAENGRQALELATEKRPDLVILDVMMPGGLDGYEVCRRLKRNPITKSCVVLMLTAREKKVDRKTGFDAGADGYFTKPFSPLELLTKIEQVFDE